MDNMKLGLGGFNPRIIVELPDGKFIRVTLPVDMSVKLGDLINEKIKLSKKSIEIEIHGLSASVMMDNAGYEL